MRMEFTWRRATRGYYTVRYEAPLSKAERQRVKVDVAAKPASMFTLSVQALNIHRSHAANPVLHRDSSVVQVVDTRQCKNYRSMAAISGSWRFSCQAPAPRSARLARVVHCERPA